MKDWAWLPRFIPDFLDSLDSLNSWIRILRI